MMPDICLYQLLTCKYTQSMSCDRFCTLILLRASAARVLACVCTRTVATDALVPFRANSILGWRYLYFGYTTHHNYTFGCIKNMNHRFGISRIYLDSSVLLGGCGTSNQQRNVDACSLHLFKGQLISE